MRPSSLQLRARRVVRGALTVATLFAAVACGRSARLPEGALLVVGDTATGSGDQALGESVRQVTIAGLQQTPYFTVVSETRMRGVLRDMRRPPDQPTTPDVAREVCGRLKGQVAIALEAAPKGDGFALTLAAVDCATGASLVRRETAAPARADLVPKLGDAVADLRAALGEPAASVKQYNAPLGTALSSTVDAVRAFSLGNKARGAVGDEAALPFFQRAVDLDADFAPAWSRLGVVAASTGRVGLSRQAAAKAYALRARATSYDRLYITWNHAARVLHDDAATRAALTELVTTYPRDFAARNNLGVYHVGHGEFEQALEQYRAAAAIAPEESIPAINIAYTLLFLRQRDEAFQTMAQVLRTRPDVNVMIARWTSAAITGDPRAADFEREAAASVPPAQLDLARASLALWSGRLAEYVRLEGEIKKQALAYKNETAAASIDANVNLVRAAFEQGPAIPALVASLKGSASTTSVALAAALLGSIGDTAAVKALLPAIDADPDPSQTVVVSGTIAHAYVRAAEGDPAGALKDVETMLVEFPQALDANIHLGRLRELAGNLDGAIAAYRVVVQAQPILGANPAIAPARLYLAGALEKKGDAAGAKEQRAALTAQWKDADSDFPWRKAAKKP